MLDEGAVAQLGERLVCNQEATGSIPVSSTKDSNEAIACNSLLGADRDNVAWFDTVGTLSRSFEADPVVGALDLRSDIRFLVLRCVQGFLAIRAKAQPGRFSLMLGVNATTDSVSRFMNVAWRRTLGWRNFRIVHGLK